MAYRLRYAVNIDFVGAGEGPMTGIVSAPPPGGGAGSLTLEFGQATPVGGPIVPGTGTAYPAGNALVAADVDTLLAALTADVAAQMKAAPTLARLAAWPQGGAAAQ